MKTLYYYNYIKKFRSKSINVSTILIRKIWKKQDGLCFVESIWIREKRGPNCMDTLNLTRNFDCCCWIWKVNKNDWNFYFVLLKNSIGLRSRWPFKVNLRRDKLQKLVLNWSFWNQLLMRHFSKRKRLEMIIGSKCLSESFVEFRTLEMNIFSED